MKNLPTHRILLLFCMIFIMTPALALEPDEILSDPQLEQRARDLGKQLRCLVCQNEAIDGSNADFAKDIRVLVREQLQQGKTDEEIKQFLVSRYGEFILLNPTLNMQTLMLWSFPALLLLGTVLFLLLKARPQSANPPNQLTGEEEARIKELLDKQNN